MGTFKDEEKLQDALINYRKKCPCGHSMVVLPRKDKDYIICRWCGKRVFKDDAKQLEHNKKVERENFRITMWGGLRKNERKVRS